jgi:hypothetical protein
MSDQQRQSSRHDEEAVAERTSSTRYATWRGGLANFRGLPTKWKIHWILRIAVGLEFIGHGAFGIKGKEAWLAYYDVLGIPASIGWKLMPIAGIGDITLGLLVLIWPMRAPIAYMAFWGFFTASLRPLAGEGIWEFVERSYNFGVPLALLLLHGPGTSLRHWFARITEMRPLAANARGFAWGLRAIIGAYLIGHGGLGLFTDKPLLIEEYDSIGLTSLVNDPHTLNEVVGLFEIGLGVLVFTWPATGLLVFVLGWKLCTEMLYVTMGAYGAGWEVIERASAYAAPLALICFLSVLSRQQRHPSVAGHIGRLTAAGSPRA